MLSNKQTILPHSYAEQNQKINESLALARDLFSQNRLEDAFSVLMQIDATQIISHRDQNTYHFVTAQYYLRKGLEFFQQQNHQAALNMFHLIRHPEVKLPLVQMIECCRALGQDEQADFYKFQLDLAQSEMALLSGDAKRAKTRLHNMSLIYKAEWLTDAYHLLRAKALSACGKYDGALKELSKIKDRQPNLDVMKTYLTCYRFTRAHDWADIVLVDLCYHFMKERNLDEVLKYYASIKSPIAKQQIFTSIVNVFESINNIQTRDAFYTNVLPQLEDELLHARACQFYLQNGQKFNNHDFWKKGAALLVKGQAKWADSHLFAALRHKYMFSEQVFMRTYPNAIKEKVEKQPMAFDRFNSLFKPVDAAAQRIEALNLISSSALKK